MLQIILKNTKPHSKILTLWLCCFCFINGVLFFSCSKEEIRGKASLILKNNVGYTKDGDHLPMGGVVKIGILASGSGSPLTYLRIIRISGSDTITELDKGLYIGSDDIIIFDEGIKFLATETHPVAFFKWKDIQTVSDKNKLTIFSSDRRYKAYMYYLVPKKAVLLKNMLDKLYTNNVTHLSDLIGR